MSSDKLEQFRNAKCINLETYRKDGQAVQTPVWYVMDDNIIYVATPVTTGKIKRLTANKHVRITPCNFRGDPKGDWIEAEAYFANKSKSETHYIMTLKPKVVKNWYKNRLFTMDNFKNEIKTVSGLWVITFVCTFCVCTLPCGISMVKVAV